MCHAPTTAQARELATQQLVFATAAMDLKVHRVLWFRAQITAAEEVCVTTTLPHVSASLNTLAWIALMMPAPIIATTTANVSMAAAGAIPCSAALIAQSATAPTTAQPKEHVHMARRSGIQMQSQVCWQRRSASTWLAFVRLVGLAMTALCLLVAPSVLERARSAQRASRSSLSQPCSNS